MDLEPDFKEFLELLNRNGVRYLIVGGYALAVHGRPRYTKDLDVWVEIADENAQRVVKTINDFGFESFNLTKEDFLEPGTFVQLGYEPVRIDLLTQPDGVEFAGSFETRLEWVVDGISINVIGLENLKRNKRASGRLQDLADLEQLEQQ
jgi:Nucleotidyl transferase of unknown function (DUF2204)